MPPIAIRRSHSALATNGNEMPSATTRAKTSNARSTKTVASERPPGIPCGDLEPACAKEVADPARKDVVHGDSAHDHSPKQPTDTSGVRAIARQRRAWTT